MNKKTYSIKIEPSTITRQGLQNIEQFLTELSAIDDVEVSEQKLEFCCDLDLEGVLNQLAEKYSIVNLIGLLSDEKL